jgi:hypothetical protein
MDRAMRLLLRRSRKQLQDMKARIAAGVFSIEEESPESVVNGCGQLGNARSNTRLTTDIATRRRSSTQQRHGSVCAKAVAQSTHSQSMRRKKLIAALHADWGGRRHRNHRRCYPWRGRRRSWP